jgi:hypothetical protein
MKKKTYVPSKSTNEKAGAVLKEMRIEQARLDLSKSNKRMGLRPLDVSTSETTTKTTISNNNDASRPRSNSKKL